MPENLDYKNLFPENTFHYLYVLDCLYHNKIFKKDKLHKGFVSLNMRYLQRVLTWRKAKKIIDSLIELGIIETNNSFVIGERSRGYKLADRYKTKTIRVEVNDIRLVKRLLRLKEERENDFPVRYKPLRAMLEKIEIDYCGAVKFIDSYCTPANYKLRKVNKSKHYTFEDWRNHYLCSVKNIHNKEFYCSVDKKGHRLHTPISNLPSVLRQFLRYKGNKLVSLDVKNSQCFLLSAMLVEFYCGGFYFKNTISTYSLPFFSTSHTPHNNKFELPSYSTPLQLSDNIISNYGNIPVDAKKYINLTSQGALYPFLMQGLNITDRQAFKTSLFGHVFYNDIKNKKNKFKEERIFQKEFPSVLDFIKLRKKENYKNFPIAMQRMESKIILDNIAMRLVKEFPVCYFLTIHDSFLTNQEFAPVIKDIMLEEFQKCFNITPSIKVDY